MKRNSYDQLRKVVMAGWCVGFSFIFFFLTLSFKLKYSQMFGGKHPLKMGPCACLLGRRS